MDNYQGYYSMTFHSELQIVRLIFEGGVSSIVDSMHEEGERGVTTSVLLLWEKIVSRCFLRRSLC